ncbi:MAG TPA: tetratricopeptide repeat protein [Casimicrobiaceae bacterium]|nr:tetratricopeptide repeat protein [Casimicrobiaceae bacterium]
MPLNDAQGLAVSSTDVRSLAALDAAMVLLQASRGDPEAVVAAALDRDPGFVMGHCARAALRVLAGENTTDARLKRATAAVFARAGSANDRERRHAEAARAWLDGEVERALLLYGDLLVDYPRDVLALHVAHALDFRLGRREMLRDRIAQVLPHWDASVPGYGHVLAMHAFGLEENGDYVAAEAAARRALRFAPDSAAATHVMAHVFEMQGRSREGIEWLQSTRNLWAASGYNAHNNWHLALFWLDLEQADKALAIYDRALVPATDSATHALIDASSLLWRLRLRGVDLGMRWSRLAYAWKSKALHGMRVFALVHAAIAFAGAGHAWQTGRVLRLLRRHARADHAYADAAATLGLALCVALIAFCEGRYAEAVARLGAVRHMALHCGGSAAQCDIIHLTLVESALRAQRARLAHALVAERAARKPRSRFNDWLLARARGVPAAA